MGIAHNTGISHFKGSLCFGKQIMKKSFIGFKAISKSQSVFYMFNHNDTAAPTPLM